MHARLLLSCCLQVVQGPFSPSLLEGYWTKEPLLIRQAFAEDEALPTRQQILDLAKLDTCRARVISHDNNGDLHSFTMRHGNDTINSKCSTLLINNVEKVHHSLYNWMYSSSNFAFIPEFIRDDAQISLAPTAGGSIGPHADNYDVFLVQVSGSKEWRVGANKLSIQQEYKDLIPDLNVRILDAPYTYHPSVILKPGDVLYLPPRVVHWGTATSDNCITLSVGCRSPSLAEFLSAIEQKWFDYENGDHIASPNTESVGIEALGKRFAAVNAIKQQTDYREEMKQFIRDNIEMVLSDDELFDSIIQDVMDNQAGGGGGSGMMIEDDNVYYMDYDD